MLNEDYSKYAFDANEFQTHPKKVIIFGASALGKSIYNRIKDTEKVLFFIDNDPNNCYPPPAGVTVCKPDILSSTQFDCVYIAACRNADVMYRQLKEELKVEDNKINRDFTTDDVQNDFLISPRTRFLEQFSNYAYTRGITGAVAEVGVFRGDFAKEINLSFPDRKLYLFDTFEGFDERDLRCEQKRNARYTFFEESYVGKFETTVETVIHKMTFQENVLIKKGYFPESFDISNEKFAFVNLDTDLYQPIKAGLEIFFPLMVKGGVILIHDYFTGATLGVREAVDEFLEANGLSAIPIGDYASIAIIK